MTVEIIAVTFGQFLPHVFVLCCVGIVYDHVITAFRGGRL